MPANTTTKWQGDHFSHSRTRTPRHRLLRREHHALAAISIPSFGAEAWAGGPLSKTCIYALTYMSMTSRVPLHAQEPELLETILGTSATLPSAAAELADLQLHLALHRWAASTGAASPGSASTPGSGSGFSTSSTAAPPTAAAVAGGSSPAAAAAAGARGGISSMSQAGVDAALTRLVASLADISHKYALVSVACCFPVSLLVSHKRNHVPRLCCAGGEGSVFLALPSCPVPYAFFGKAKE